MFGDWLNSINIREIIGLQMDKDIMRATYS